MRASGTTNGTLLAPLRLDCVDSTSCSPCDALITSSHAHLEGTLLAAVHTTAPSSCMSLSCAPPARSSSNTPGSSPHNFPRTVPKPEAPSLLSFHPNARSSLRDAGRAWCQPYEETPSTRPRARLPRPWGARLLRAVHRPAGLSETARRREELDSEVSRGGICFPASVTRARAPCL